MKNPILGTYDRIDEVVLIDGNKTFLLVDSNNKNEFEVDLRSDFFFNEFDIESRNTIKSVGTLSEVVQFCKENNIIFNQCNVTRLKDDALLVGGEADMLVNEALEYFWITE